MISWASRETRKQSSKGLCLADRGIGEPGMQEPRGEERDYGGLGRRGHGRRGPGTLEAIDDRTGGQAPGVVDDESGSDR